MATETVVSYPTSTIDEQVEKKVEEVEKAIDHDSISSSKEKGEENSKVEDSPSPAPALTTVQPEGVEDKQIEQPLVAEVLKATVAPENDVPAAESNSFSSSKENEEEKLRYESLPSPATPSSISGATEDKHIEPPVVEVEKAADAPVLVESHSTVSSTKENEEEKPKAEDKLIESPVVEVEKASDDPVLEVPAVESQSLSSTKGNEEEKSKADDVPTPATPSHEPEDTKEKLIEPPVVEAEKAADAPALVVEQVSATSSSKESGEEASTDAENSQTTKTISLESGGVEEKQVEPPVVEVEKTVDAPISDVPIIHERTTEKDIDSTTTSGPELVDASAKNQTEVKTTIEDVVEEAPKQPSVDIVEKVQEEQPKIVDVHESSVETIDKLKDTLEPSPVQVESEASAVVKEIKDSKLVSIIVEKPEPEVAEVEEKPAGEPLELTEQVDKKGENVEPKESVEEKTTKDEKTLADKVEDSISLKVDETDKDAPPNPTVSSEVSTDQTAQSDPKDEGNSSLPSVAEPVIGEEEKKETSKVDVVEKISKYVSLETGKVGEENAAEKANVIIEDSTQLSIPKEDEVADSSLKKADRDFKPAEENKIAGEQIKDETPTSAETKKDENVEEVTSAVNKPLEEAQQPEELVKKEEIVQTDAKELEKVEDIAKSDQNPEPPTKEDDHTKTSQDQPKEVPAKPTQKQSNNLISKVKQSLVKAKKAIIGKSPNSKTPASEAKDDIKVK